MFKPARVSPTRSTVPTVMNEVNRSGSLEPEHSHGSHDEASGTEAEQTTRAKRSKRSRACIACRNMKIRCLPVEGKEACSACLKVNRECIMPGPPRKRQKTVHKVAELEKKINALTDALLAKNHQTDEGVTQSSSRENKTTTSSEPTGNADTPATETSRLDPRMDPVMEPQYSGTMGFIEQAFPKGLPAFHPSCKPWDEEAQSKDHYVDVVDRGELSMERATVIFKCWASEMVRSCPMVVFPPGTEAQEVRVKRPFTFLAILTVASPLVLPEYHTALNTELNRQLSDRVLFQGEKSLDLVQAMILNFTYYARPRSGRDLSFNQYIHCAAVMCFELGIGRRTKVDPARSPAEMVELRRTWLACYQCVTTVSHFLRHPALIRHSAYIDECLSTLSTSPYALPSDTLLCTLVRLQRLAEEVTIAFNMDDPCAELSFTDAKTQYQLRTFEHQLSLWEKSLDVTLDPRLLRHQTACARLYMHEIAIHQDHDVDVFRLTAPFPEGMQSTGSFVTSSHIASLATCLEAAHAVLDTYLGLEVPLARSLSNLYIVWNTYALVVLIKLHGIVHAPDSKFGGVFIPDVRVAFYVEAMLEKMATLAANGHSPCAEAFGFVYKKLQSWHVHRVGQVGDVAGDEKPEVAYVRRGMTERQARGDRDELNCPLGTTSNPSTDRPAASSDPSLPRRDLHSQTLPHQTLPPRSTSRNAPRPAPGHAPVQGLPTSDLNAAYDAASYGRTNWAQFDFSREEMDLFDVYMNDNGWMGYLL